MQRQEKEYMIINIKTTLKRIVSFYLKIKLLKGLKIITDLMKIDNKSYFGTWNFYKKNLVLSLEKKLDSTSIQNTDSLSTIIRPMFFIPKRQLKKYTKK